MSRALLPEEQRLVDAYNAAWDEVVAAELKDDPVAEDKARVKLNEAISSLLRYVDQYKAEIYSQLRV